MNLNDVEILIPTFNEEKNLPITINSLKKAGLENLTILDALSDDETVKVAKENNCKVLIDPTRRLGFGYSLINGIKNSKSKYLCIFDADGSFDPNTISQMKNLLEAKNLDFVFGSRYLNGNKSDDDTLLTRFGNFLFTKLISLLFNFNTTDALFLYLFGKRECFINLNLEEKDFKICTEALIKARTNYKCDEIYSHENKRIFGTTKVNRFKDGYLMLSNVFNLWLKK
ncbi:glycosyltransferase family 2 protein [Candidatus Pelagibacter sp.]|uniref:glycosyltransferase family 2 protein n=1 Tax=Candidatus Pelagibacter sp. TaxID=2024849 RepID=UPI003F826BC9